MVTKWYICVLVIYITQPIYYYSQQWKKVIQHLLLFYSSTFKVLHPSEGTQCQLVNCSRLPFCKSLLFKLPADELRSKNIRWRCSNILPIRYSLPFLHWLGPICFFAWTKIWKGKKIKKKGEKNKEEKTPRWTLPRRRQ
jgi:hypothetical protein